MFRALLLPLLVLAAPVSQSTKDHLRSLEQTVSRLEAEGNTGKYYEKVKAEIARIKREYGLAASPKAEPRARGQKPAGASASAADWQGKKDDFMRAAAEELKRREKAKAGDSSAFYASKAEWQKVYDGEMQFARGRVAAGGLGFDFSEAEAWVKVQMKLKSPAEMAVYRRRYAKAVMYLQIPVEKGGPGFVRGYARKMALELVEKTGTEAGLDQWIIQDKARRAAARPSGGFARFKRGCEDWFKSFSG